LPEERFIEQLLPQHFILFQPKDIVSGDFYWVDRKDNLIYLAVADCTGHGVPGAFMSIIGYNLLNQAVHEKGLSSPELILNYLNIGISTTLGQDDAERQKKAGIKDGMDIALVVIDLKTNKLQYAGAQRPLVIVRSQELIEFKGNRMPVGGYLFGQYLRFDLHEIDIQSGDRLYLFTDGFSDQFGGENQKKFKYAKKRELLFSLREAPFSEHRQILRESYEIWKGNQEQIDDICIFGVQIP
jgi:serine phosphatase RsbU (regulator of sigma subunit)